MHNTGITFIVALLLTLTFNTVATANSISDTRKSTSTINGVALESEHPQIPNADSIKQDSGNQLNQRNVLSINHGLWIYDLLISFGIDNDADGLYSNFSITLDIDNSFSPRNVYAVFYLSQNNGPWFEYAVTGNFNVSGSSASDSVSIETTFETGYPGDYYDILVEVYDANLSLIHI